MLDERFLQRMQDTVCGKALDRGAASSRHPACTANVRHEFIRLPLARTVQGQALPVIAAHFCAGEADAIAKRIEQGCPWGEFELPFNAIYD